MEFLFTAEIFQIILRVSPGTADVGFDLVVRKNRANLDRDDCSSSGSSKI
jgi:hypothetical protein